MVLAEKMACEPVHPTEGTEKLLGEIEDFLKCWRMRPSRFGQLCFRDDRFVSKLRSGRKLWQSTAERARAFMEGYEAAAKK